MSILKYKYQAHKFVNYIFYIIVFAIGFFFGYAGKNIDFKSLIANILFIDNVKAYDIETQSDFTFTESDLLTSVYSLNPDFDFGEFQYVFCDNIYSNNTPTLTCYFFNDESLYNINIFHYDSSIDAYYFNLAEPCYKFESNYNSNGLYSSTFGLVSGSKFFRPNSSSSNFNFYSYSANNLNENKLSSLNSTINKLDFTGYNLTFNPDLFANNNDFKEVCVDNHSSYAITRTSNPQNLDYMTDYDYIWFPYNIHPNDISLVNYMNDDTSDLSAILNSFNDPNYIFTPGLSSFIGTLDASSHIYTFDSLAFNFYNSKQKIDSVFNVDPSGSNLNYKGYTNKYSYYGWSSLLFNLWFDYRNDSEFNFFPIITFDINHSTVSLGSSGTAHGGGGRRLGVDDEEILNEISVSETYCFYIKNEYSVTKVNLDEFNDFYGTVPTQNGDFDFYTSANKMSMDSRDLFSIVSNFMTKISSTIHFINTNIYNLYSSLPLIVRMFILSCLTLFIVKLIIDMIVR